MNPCELCEEYGCHNCALGNPCIGCADYDMETILAHPKELAGQRWMKKRRTLMTNYSDIEIQTAQSLLKEGYKWIARYESGRLFAHSAKPSKEYISFHFVGCEVTCLPCFKKGTMYKGMEADKNYNPEELGL